MMTLTPTHTKLASYVGYLTQAITINFAPLLFVTFQREYGLTLAQIGSIIAVGFLVQFSADAMAAKFGSRLPPRATVITAHLCAVIGLCSMALLPDLLPSPYLGLMIANALATLGGGLIEVEISPIVEACPTGGKRAAMSLLHSFYSWGFAGTVLLSTLFFTLFGVSQWRILACLMAIVPAIGALAFCFVPIYTLEADEAEANTPFSTLLRSGAFWLFLLLMFCAGAAEQIMGRWTSGFAETGLGVSKTLGDLLGPCAFAILMGTARILYAAVSRRLSLHRYMTVCALLCTLTYLIAALSPLPVISLIGCAACGYTIAVLWPGTYSLSAARMPHGGVRMFAMLALAGDLGGIVGPFIASSIATRFNDDLRPAFLFSVIFPLTISVSLILFYRKHKKINRNRT